MKQRINLVPKQALAKIIKRITLPLVLTLTVVSCLVILFMGMRVASENKVLQDEILVFKERDQKLQEQQLEIARITGNIKKLKSDTAQLQKVVGNLAGIPKQKQFFSRILLGISGVIPASVHCEEVMIGSEFGQLSGRATEYSELPIFVEKLNSLPRLYGASLHVVNQSQKEGLDVLSFNVVFQLERNR